MDRGVVKEGGELRKTSIKNSAAGEARHKASKFYIPSSPGPKQRAHQRHLSKLSGFSLPTAKRKGKGSKKKRGLFGRAVRGLGSAFVTGLKTYHGVAASTRKRRNSEEPMKEPTAKQKRARSKNKNHPSPKQLAARRKFAAMSKARARERRAAVKKAVTRPAKTNRTQATNRKKKHPSTLRKHGMSRTQQLKKKLGKKRTYGAFGLSRERAMDRSKRGGGHKAARRAKGKRSGPIIGKGAGGKFFGTRLPNSRTSGDTRSEVRSPTRTSTSTRARTAGNVTVTGGAGRGATTKVTIARGTRPVKNSRAQSRKNKPKKPIRRNSAVNEVFRTFVGRDSANINEVDFPNGSPTNLAQLGLLTELKSETETFQFAESERVFLAADGRGNLYVGGKQQPVEPNTSFGKLLGISYVCKKTHIEPGKTIEYVHKFGDEGGKCPTLRSDKEGRFTIKGGTYTVTSAGIAD